MLLEWLGVDVLFDVGAHVGHYAAGLRSAGYQAQIVSFEPMTAAFRELEAAAQDDPRWAVHNFGLGRTSGEAEINISADSVSSSVLPMADRVADDPPRDTRYVGSETIRTEPLDSVCHPYLEAASRVGIKLDVQGYELEVLAGGAELLRRAAFVQCELLFVDFYAGQPGFNQLVNVFYEAGLRLGAFELGHENPETGALEWGDGFFVRDGAA